MKRVLCSCNQNKYCMLFIFGILPKGLLYMGLDGITYSEHGIEPTSFFNLIYLIICNISCAMEHQFIKKEIDCSFIRV